MRSLRKDAEGHYEVALPFKETHQSFPCNWASAQKSLTALAARFERDPELAAEYRMNMSKLIEDGHMEEVGDRGRTQRRGQVWYLPHFAVRHPVKQKLRVVFDCARKWSGVSLNDGLLRGPDLLNSLIGVLSRFRLRRVAFVADIRGMFHQVRVPESQRDHLRVLWWREGMPERGVVVFRMKTHVFGAVSSPSVANFALQQAARDAPARVSAEAREVLLTGAYVDDVMASTDQEEDLVRLMEDVHEASCLARRAP